MRNLIVGVLCALVLIVYGIKLSGNKLQDVDTKPEPTAASIVLPPVKLDAESVKRLRHAATQDQEGDVRWAAAQLLLKIEDAESLIILQDMVAQDPEASVRRRAVDALGSLNDPTALPILVEALKDSEGEVKMAALRHLARLGDASTIPYVSNLTRDEDMQVRGEATKAADSIRTRTGARK